MNDTGCSSVPGAGLYHPTGIVKEGQYADCQATHGQHPGIVEPVVEFLRPEAGIGWQVVRDGLLLIASDFIDKTDGFFGMSGHPLFGYQPHAVADEKPLVVGQFFREFIAERKPADRGTVGRSVRVDAEEAAGADHAD